MNRSILLVSVFTIGLLLALSGSAASAVYEFAPKPEGYPTGSISDTFAEIPYEPDYEVRRQDFLRLNTESEGNGPFSEAIKMYMGQMPWEESMRSRLEKMDNRLDTADFGMQGIQRVLYQFGESGMLSEGFLAHVEDTLLNFKYWPDELEDADEVGPDSMCTWTENHFILFSTGAYLSGQYYPDRRFKASGRTGHEQMEKFRPRILRWLDLRYQTGFSEWLSNGYYDEDMPPLLNLIDFCEDPEIVKKATMVVDLILTDIALNQLKGTFGSTHGRGYFSKKIDGGKESTGSVCKLLFGVNKFSRGNMSATCFALSEKYRVPKVIHDMATDYGRTEMINRQRAGIRIEDAKRMWGLDYNKLEDGMTFLTLEAYTHPRTINLFKRMLDEYNWWESSFFKPFKDQKDLIEGAYPFLLPFIAKLFEKDLTRNMRPEVNIYTYRTPDYMLSSAQDWRKGYGGDQQSIWQATLGKEATCFTTHPAQLSGDSPNYWTGSGNLPRVAQVKNVALILYKISTAPGIYVTHELVYTHAWLARDKFDDVRESDRWIFARKGDAYLALWSKKPYEWCHSEEEMESEQCDPNGELNEVRAEGKQNVWICELGRLADYPGGFDEFMAQVGSAHILPGILGVTYESPSQGSLHFSWIGPLTQDDEPVEISDYPRYGNVYADAPFPGDAIRLSYNDEWLELDYQPLTRNASRFLGGEAAVPAGLEDGANLQGTGDGGGFCFIETLR